MQLWYRLHKLWSKHVSCSTQKISHDYETLSSSLCISCSQITDFFVSLVKVNKSTVALKSWMGVQTHICRNHLIQPDPRGASVRCDMSIWSKSLFFFLKKKKGESDWIWFDVRYQNCTLDNALLSSTQHHTLARILNVVVHRPIEMEENPLCCWWWRLHLVEL